MTTTTPTPQPPKTRPRRPRWLAPVVVLVVLGAVAAGVGVGIGVARNDDTVAVSSEFQLSTVRASCEEWMMASGSDNGNADDAWCSGMVSWMRANSSSMMGSRMWDGPDQLRDACDEWAGEDQAEMGSTSAGTATPSCDDMVTWMDAHMMDGWGSGSMMNDR